AQRGRGHRALGAVAPVGVGGDGPREQTAAGDRCRGSYPHDGPTRGPPRRAGLGPRLRPPVSHGWLSRVHDGLGDPLWVLGAAATPPGARPYPQAALDAAAPTALAQFIGLCSRSKWSKHRTKSPFLALLAMAGSNAAYKIISACSNAVS